MYKIFWRIRQNVGHMSSVNCLCAMEDFFVIYDEDREKMKDTIERLGIDIKIKKSFDTKEDAINWYTKYKKDLALLEKEYNDNHKGFFQSKVRFSLSDEIYILESVEIG